MEKFTVKNNLQIAKDGDFVPNRNRMRTVLKNSPFQKKQKELFDYFNFLTSNLYELEQTDSEQKRIPLLFDQCKAYSDLLQVMYMQEQLISNHPTVQKYTDDVRRISILRHKNSLNKPWGKSNQYVKTKLVEHLANDAKDTDIFLNIFQQRDKSQEASFNLQSKADMGAQDVIFDSFVLSDFLTFGKTTAETRELLYMLDGIVLLPALIFFHKFGQAPDVDSLEGIYNKDTGVIVATIFAGLGFILRPIIVGEVHTTYYRK